VASAWGQTSPLSKADAFLLPFEQAYVQASSGEWKRSLDLLEQFSMRWHMQSPAPSAKAEADLNAAARALLTADSAPAAAVRALSGLSKTVSEALSPALGGREASPQFFNALAAIAAGSLDSTQDSRPEQAATQIQLFDALWGVGEDAVHAKDPGAYAHIEAGIDTALSALQAQPADVPAATSALGGLIAAVQGQAAGAPAAASAPAVSVGIPDLLAILAQTRAALSADNPRRALAGMQAFVTAWPLAETGIKARSPAIYAKIESQMTEAGGLLLSGPGGRAHAAAVMQAMTEELSGLGEQTSYTAWDAGMILLREGMEALLVLAALLAMLKKGGGRRSAAWVWTGAGTGLVLSGILAVILGFVISAAAAGNAREQLEGFVGLASVGLMVTVGAWLHRRSSLKAWNSFIKDKVGGALASGSMASIFALALVAVLREGAETVVFYIGIAPAISLAHLLLGISGALLILVVIGYLIIRFSVRLPLRWFFLVATLLIYYLAFKIAGESIHALQIVGVLPNHPLAWLPSAGFLGMYPTWETFAPQMVVLLYALVELLFTELKSMAAKRATAQTGAAGAHSA
ncbi:MAG TPA: FTR1 family protein, partial [Spirochaetia bacterium]|nr:FTR1 family protein [Spirochaetia bacterium]